MTRAPRAPRLVSRFAILTAVGVTAAGAAILAVVQHTYTVQGERQAIAQARYVAESALSTRLRPADFGGQLPAARREALNRMFRRTVLVDGMVAAVLYNAPRKAGLCVGSERRPPASVGPQVSTALTGNVVSRVGASDFGSGRALRTFVPVGSGRKPRGVVELAEDYGPIASSARHSSLIIAGVLEAVLIGLFVLLLPMVARARRRIGVAETHDELTGLANRLEFQQAIERLDASSGTPAVLLADVAAFHELNDTLGPERGDRLLVQIANRLSGLKGAACVARLGGDEFALLVNGTESRVTSLAEEVQQSLEAPFGAAGEAVRADAVLGAAVMVLDEDAATVLQHAGVALRVAKENRSRFELYEPALGDASVSQLSLAGELREALARGELCVYYQPQADLATHAVRGVEALVRWQHPRRGLLAAGEFMPIAERTSLVGEIDRLVLETAAAQWWPWNELGIVLDIAVNTSAVGLIDPGLLVQIDGVLARHGLPPEHLVLEVTEHTLLRNEETVTRTLSGLADRGIRLAIDDYGTGYSSLSYLRNLHARQIKLDRVFVAGIPDDEADERIVGSTIRLAHALGATVVAEGVETIEQWNHLHSLGCDVAQGYLIGPPQPANELTEKLIGNTGLVPSPVLA